MGAEDEGIALTGVPTTVDVGLWKEGDSRMTDSKAGACGAEASARPGNDGEEMTPGAGKDGESTIMPGICIDGFEGPCEGPAPLGVFVGTTMGVPPRDGIFGDDRAVVVSGVDKLDPGDRGARGVAGSPKDILN